MTPQDEAADALGLTTEATMVLSALSDYTVQGVLSLVTNLNRATVDDAVQELVAALSTTRSREGGDA